MPDFLIRLLIVVLILWLLQTFLGTFGLKEPANKVIFVIALVVGVVYLLFGYTNLLGH